MKALKIFYKLSCLCITVGIILCFQNSSITMETKSSNINFNKTINLNSMAKVVKTFAMADINSVLDTYNGKLTGYVADCPLCNGHLACNGQDVLDRTTTYHDETYGVVRIVASSSNLPCGSIVKFDTPVLGEVTAVVLDRGVTGTSLDLLVESTEQALTQVGSKNINYDVLRYGWKRTNA